MLRIEYLLNKRIAKNAAIVVADAAQAELMRSKHTLSGDDSNLESTWEEICVQVRGEKSFFWKDYESAMRDAVLGILIFLDREVLETLWLHSDDGWDLLYDLKADEKEGLTNQAGYLPPPPTEVPAEIINPPPPPPEKPICTEDFSVVTEYLHTCLGHGTAAIHLVLSEDTYESLNGDGEYHYPEIVFFNLEGANTYEGDKSGGYKYHIRPGVIWLDQDTIGYEVPRRQFDHFSGEEVLRLVTKSIERKQTEEC